MSPFTSPISVDLANAFFAAVCTGLGPGWTLRADHSRRHPLRADVRSARGHHIELLGAHDHAVYAMAHLPNREHRPFTIVADKNTPESYAAAFTRLITGTLVPLHDALCPVACFQAALSTALGDRKHSGFFEFGTAHTSWDLPAGGGARLEARRAWVDNSPEEGAERGPDLDVTAYFTRLPFEQTLAVLSVLDLANNDKRRFVPVCGLAARRLHAAFPFLRGHDVFNWPTRGGRHTVSLSVDNHVHVLIRGTGDEPHCDVTVDGAANVLAAVRAL
ncbi:hypothetical protein ACIQ9R_36230 [Streptomyces sp. NPDC094447]|uniref:hypothetical protein n=1 Tax=Streptomyces sp. NPDC094447 TaxID=3366062 RepID=UPI003807CBDD